MLQFYLLAVLFCVFNGFLLIKKSDKSILLKDEKDCSKGSVPVNEMFLGVLSVITGIMKIFLVAGSSILFLGDFFPFVFCVLSGTALIIDYYNRTSSVEVILKPFVKLLFVTGKKYLGIFSVVFGILHFLFPNAMFF